MNEEPINIEIDVTKIDKNRLKTVTLKSGHVAKYLKARLFPRRDDYGNDYMITESVTKEEIEAGVKGAILGNAKIHGKKPAGQTNGNQPARRSSAPPAKQPADSGLEWDGTDEKLPF